MNSEADLGLMSPRVLFFVALAGIAGAACGGNSGGNAKPPCEGSSPPAACGMDCSTSPAVCTGGTYCGPGGTCTADCQAGDGRCASGMVCNTNVGQCVDGPSSEGGGGGSVGVGGGAGGGGGGDGDGGMSCPDLSVTADPLEPYIVLVVDHSGSMKTDYDGSTSRWNAVRNVLIGTGGIIEQFQSVANIALVQYTGLNAGDGTPSWDFQGNWPELIETPAKLGNLSDIQTVYQDDTDPDFDSANDTPTGEALWVTMCHLGVLDTGDYDGDGDRTERIGCGSYEANNNVPVSNQPELATAPLLLPAVGTGPGQRDPNAKIVMVLATDGLPNNSVDPDGDADPTSDVAVQAREWAIDAAEEARSAGVLTYVISVAGSTNLDLHLQHLACEGGTGPLPASAPYDGAYGDRVCENPMPASEPGLAHADDSDALRTALEAIVGDLPCSFQLDGMVNDVDAAREQGEVTLGGNPLALDQANGWYLEDDGRTFTLNGTACDDFRANPGSQLKATFACDGGIVIIPL